MVYFTDDFASRPGVAVMLGPMRWWSIAALLLAVFYTSFAIWEVSEPGAGELFLGLAAAVLVLGLFVRRRSPAGGNALLIVTSLPRVGDCSDRRRSNTCSSGHSRRCPPLGRAHRYVTPPTFPGGPRFECD